MNKLEVQEQVSQSVEKWLKRRECNDSVGAWMGVISSDFDTDVKRPYVNKNQKMVIQIRAKKSLKARVVKSGRSLCGGISYTQVKYEHRY